MKKVMLNKNLGENFGKSYIPKIYVNLLKDELNDKKYIPLLTRLKETFNITKGDIMKIIQVKNIIVSQVTNQYVVRFNNKLIKNSIPLEQVIDYINDGDLSFRGYNIFNNVASYINKNIETIHRYYLMQGD